MSHNYPKFTTPKVPPPPPRIPSKIESQRRLTKVERDIKKYVRENKDDIIIEINEKGRNRDRQHLIGIFVKEWDGTYQPYQIVQFVTPFFEELEEEMLHNQSLY